MILFFRKIREKLIQKNQVTRYLVYAVGEIGLVMIGILLALQVNNWNVDKQSKKWQTDFLVDTQNELEKDKRQLEEIIKFQESKELKSLELIPLLEKPIPDKKDKIDSLFSYLSSSNATFFPNVGVFENALFAGKIDLVENDELKYTIMDLYMRSYKRLVYNGEIYDERYDLVS
ncbi:hypothetical protein JYB62_13280 [Algoriphagus lutimaris]|uniref:DUF6090 family protein n=1 Tax=Algoriphagus lutimaris TaxID=613197 RepID=UPI00196B8108|nr:DUF6090 family protein [Algoriphagus lutimaris]MBN3520975.1 hypothetical protein [Algoriphagus lutimaris]